MTHPKAPFRADHVGSLLRPAALKQARARRASGEISADQLTAIEDREIERVVRKQEEIGLQSVTDVNSDARGGISISSGASMASNAMQ